MIGFVLNGIHVYCEDPDAEIQIWGCRMADFPFSKNVILPVGSLKRMNVLIEETNAKYRSTKPKQVGNVNY